MENKLLTWTELAMSLFAFLRQRGRLILLHFPISFHTIFGINVKLNVYHMFLSGFDNLSGQVRLNL